MKRRSGIANMSINAKVLGIALVAILAMGIFANKNFLSVGNFMSILQQMSEIGIMALGLTLVILTGGIDISIGTTMGLCATITGVCLQLGMPVLPAVLCSFGVAVLCGLLNSAMIAIIGVPAMIATLGSQMFFNGIALALSQGNSISSVPESFYFLGQGQLFGVIPVQAIILAVLAVAVHIVLCRRRLGRRIYAVGNNMQASKLAGIKTTRVLTTVYVLCSVLCCVAGNIQVSRVATARADMGSVYMMQCLSAVVLGGTSIMGGKGGVGGTIVGVFIFAMIGNVMNLAGISAFWQQFAIGMILVMVLVFNRVTERRRRVKVAWSAG